MLLVAILPALYTYRKYPVLCMSEHAVSMLVNETDEPVAKHRYAGLASTQERLQCGGRMQNVDHAMSPPHQPRRQALTIIGLSH